MKPTVITFGQPTAMTDTSIKPTSMGSPIQPTSLGGVQQKNQPSPMVHSPVTPIPTSIPMSHTQTMTPATPLVKPDTGLVNSIKNAPPVVVDKVSTVPGHRVQSLNVAPKALEDLFYGHQPNDYVRAAQIIKTITPENVNHRYISLFGDRLQQDVNHFMNNVIVFQQNCVYNTASHHAHRMSAILGDILVAIKEYNPNSLFKRMLKDNPIELYQKNQHELDVLATNMVQLINQLNDQYDEFKDIGDNGREFHKEMVAYGIAAQYTMTVMPDYAPQWLDRAQSFQKQSVLLHNAISQVELMLATTDKWSTRIRDIERTSYPNVRQIMFTVKEMNDTEKHMSETAMGVLLRDLNN